MIYLYAAGFLFGMWLIWMAQRAAYRNGVTDGYGYAQEPNNPGYKEAGDYLQHHMRHRWPNLEWENPVWEKSVDGPFEHYEPDMSWQTHRVGVCQDCREDGCSNDCPCWCHGGQDDA